MLKNKTIFEKSWKGSIEIIHSFKNSFYCGKVELALLCFAFAS